MPRKQDRRISGTVTLAPFAFDQHGSRKLNMIAKARKRNGVGAALGVSAFVLAATVGGFRLGLLPMIAVSAGTFACVLALPAHSLHDAHHVDPLE